VSQRRPEEIEQDRIAHQNRVTQSQQLQNELDALKDQWAREDEARRRQIEDEGFQEHEKALRDQIEKDKAHWTAASSLVETYWENTKTAAQNAIDGIRSLFGGSSSTSNNSTRAAANRWNQIAMKEFGEGGQVFANQPVIVGDLGRPEVFVPPTGGQIVPMDRFGGPSIALNVGDINIGAGNAVTRDEVADGSSARFSSSSASRCPVNREACDGKRLLHAARQRHARPVSDAHAAEPEALVNRQGLPELCPRRRGRCHLPQCRHGSRRLGH
jgi:hypothetical protein